MDIIELQKVKKNLIETKPPIQKDVQDYLQVLLSHLNSKDGSDKERVVYNDALSICLLRYRQFHDTIDDLNSIFDYVLTYANNRDSALQNSLHIIVDKLLMFKNANVESWIDMIMLQPLTKNMFLFLEKLLKKKKAEYFISKYPNFVKDTIPMIDSDLGNAIGKTLFIVLKEMYHKLDGKTKEWYESWSKLINWEDDTLRSYLVVHLLPGVISIDPKCFTILVSECKGNVNGLVSILSMGQKMGWIHSLQQINQESLMACLVHSDARIRLDALQLIFGIGLNESSQQDKFIAVMHQFISGKLLESLNGKLGEESQRESEKYLSSLKTLLFTHLESQNNFQQNFGALRIIRIINEKIGNVFDEVLVKLLAKNLFSNYKLIRETSLDFLLECENLHELFHDDQKLAAKTFAILPRLSGRESDGAALAAAFLAVYYQKTGNLSQFMDGLYSGLGKDSGEHGFLLALAEVVNRLGMCGDYNLLLNAAKEATKTMTRILSTERIAYPNEQEFIKSKVVVNYSWKVLQSANNLFLALLEKNPIREDMIDCFSLVVNQLHTIKLRAAISSSYPAMISISRLVASVDKSYLHEYVKQEIEYIRSENKQLVTRRSGGILYVIPAILIAARGKPLVDFVFGKLFEFAELPYESESKEDIPQVHAFNTLSQLFKESQLAGHSSVFIEQALVLSLKHFDSTNWSIRNCALMLFGHLEKKIFSNAKVNSKRFFARFKKVEQTFVDYLLNGQDQIVFPILIMLERLEFTSSTLSLENAVIKLLGRKSWKVREFAAKIAASMLQPNEFNQFIKSALSSDIDFNTLHGVLMCLKYGVSKQQLELEQYSHLTFGNYYLANEYIIILDKVSASVSSQLKTYFETLIGERHTFDGGKQLFLESFVIFLLNRDKEHRSHYVELALRSQYDNVQNRVLDYVLENSLNYPDLVKQFIESNDFYYTQVKALEVYATMTDVIPFSSKSINNTEEAFVCSAHFVNDDDEEFYKKCLQYTEPTQELDARIKGFNAVFTYLKRNQTGFLFSACLLLCYEGGLFDDDEDIREDANQCISEIIKCGNVATTYLSYIFPQLAKSFIDQQYYDDLVIQMLFRNTLDVPKLEAALVDSKEGSLYSFERENFYKNEIDYSNFMAMFPVDTNKLVDVGKKVREDMEYIKNFKKAESGEIEYIPRDYVLYDFVGKTKINVKIVGGIYSVQEEDLLTLKFCEMA
ncbi:hypothetical protein G210_5819 [Candida maltosa Xu316]|uniref:Uncharacterized protein n=1 Tax=Candida maltosa (strain Xu316) TaxID=1245528 RepID=M3IS78_CANMX|nr:hypothetical protein G210_5819 [Candida maltosa Xu316]